MQIVRDLAGYSWGASDNVRRAMSKKKHKVMEENREIFVHGDGKDIPGCVANGISEAIANGIWDKMVSFASYAFNKSHAACYAIIAYQTAYLKHYYPTEYFAALLSSVIDDIKKVANYINTVREMGIKLNPPDINSGEWNFTADGDKICYGLSAIKAVGKNVVNELVKERTKNGTYKNLDDFCERLQGTVNKKTVEAFIKSGAFDCLGGTRKQYMIVYESVMDNIAKESKTQISGQLSIFDLMDSSCEQIRKMPLPNVGEYKKQELLSFEKDVLDIYVSGHPLDEYQKNLKKFCNAKSTDFQLTDEGNITLTNGTSVTVGGILTQIKKITTKKGETMAFGVIEDLYGNLDVIFFPKCYRKNYQKLIEDEKVFLKGKVTYQDDKDAALIVDEIKSFSDMKKEVWINFANMNAYNKAENILKQSIESLTGEDTVVIFIADSRKVKRLSTTFDAKPHSIQSLCDLFGEENVKVRNLAII